MTLRAWFETKHMLKIYSQDTLVILRGEDIVNTMIGDGHIFTSLGDTIFFSITVDDYLDKILRQVRPP